MLNTKGKMRRRLTLMGLSMLGLVALLIVSLLAGWLPWLGFASAETGYEHANLGVSSDKEPAAADYDGGGYSYSREALAKAGVTLTSPWQFQGLSFKWMDLQHKADNLLSAGQTLPITIDGSVSTVGLIGSATHGPSVGTITLTYTDKSQQRLTLAFNDWTLNGGKSSKVGYSNHVVARMGYRNSKTAPNHRQNVTTYLFEVELPLMQGKTLKSITLPARVSSGEQHIFALGASAGLSFTVPHKKIPTPTPSVVTTLSPTVVAVGRNPSGSGVIGATEFIGPFPSWSNAKNYHAVGDGQADDTAALQKALDDLGTQGHSPVLYLPAGTYRVTSTLKLYGRIGVSIIGEDPATTIVRWDGATGGTIFDAMGVAYSKWSRITWDGAGKADVAMYNWWDGSSNYFPTDNEHSDEVFQNVNYGIRAGKGNGGDAETTVERAHFLHCSVAGVSIEDWNALDWFIHDSLFEDNGMGVTNTNRAGNFMVDHSVFRRSTVADLAIGNTSYFSFRYNYSIGSKHFFTAAGPTGARANLTLQGNVIVDSTDTPILSSNPGPLFLIDNIIRTTVTPQVRLGGLAPGMVLSLGNTFTSATPYGIDTQYNALRAIGNQIVTVSSLNLAEPTLPGTAPNLHRTIFEVPVGSDGAAIQQQINQAAASGQDEPVVHLPAGNYSVPQTITIPANTNVRLIGDGSNNTFLGWAGGSGGTVLHLQGPSHAILQDFGIGAQGNATGILVDNADQSGGQVFGDQVNMSNMQRNTLGSLFTDGLDQTVVQLRSLYHNDNALSDSVKVVGGPQAAAGTPGSGYVGIFDGASSNNKNSYNVQNGGNLLTQDIWYESGNPGFLSLNGSGTFTLQGTNIAPATPAGSPSIDINNFNGKVSLLTAQINGVTQVRGNGANTSVLFAGDAFTEASNYLSVQSTQARVGLYANSANRSDEVVPDQSIDDAYLTTMLAQTRNQQLQALSAPARGITGVQLYRISVSNTMCGIHIQAGSGN